MPRHRLTACVMLVAVLAMLVHMAVPHHHHARHVALVCLHMHPGEGHLSQPHCVGSEPECQTGDTASCQPCDPLGQSALRPALRLTHVAAPPMPLPHFPHAFLPASQSPGLSPLLAGDGSRKRGTPYPNRLPGAPCGLSSGLRAPPCGC